MMTMLFGHMVRFAPIVNAFALLLVLLGGAPVMANDPATRPVRIVAFGDSLTAGFGLKPDEAFPVVLQRLLRARGHKVEITNAGVSGDTTAGGLARLDWTIPEGIDGVILELGANDALSGRPPPAARANLDMIINRLRARNIDVLIAGMRAPRNLGNEYANEFDRIFPDLSDKYGVPLYPFFLAGVALDPKLNLGDGIHPNAKGIAIIAERMLPAVEDLIARVRTRQASPKG